MQTATSMDDWRPGFAKRADNFHEVCDLAQAWRWEPGTETPGRSEERRVGKECA